MSIIFLSLPLLLRLLPLLLLISSYMSLYVPLSLVALDFVSVKAAIYAWQNFSCFYLCLKYECCTKCCKIVLHFLTFFLTKMAGELHGGLTQKRLFELKPFFTA